MPRCPTLALGLLLAVLATGCGGEEPELIPQNRADRLLATVGQIEEACDAEEPDQALEAVTAANQQVSQLPRGTDPRLEANLREWLAHIEGRVQNDCEPQEPEDTPTPEPTETPTPEPTETPTPEPTETPTPQPTETPPPEEVPPEEPTVEPPDSGGVPAPEDDDG